ncbi:iron-sulfur cluster repair di-iron protein [Coprobacter sp.]
MKVYEKMTVGQIVADNFDTAGVFDKYGIGYCCHGSVLFPEAVEKAGADYKEVSNALENIAVLSSANIDFKNWPIDLLVDYILKIYHKNIRLHGPEIQKLLDKVTRVHGERHPELYAVQELFGSSLEELYSHFDKEEMVLFPYIYEMVKVSEEHKTLPDFHCGSIEAPIWVMMNEHEAEGERYRKIEELTKGYAVPEDVCNSYRSVYEKLKNFDAALHRHIHLENNIVFPRAIHMERELQKS